MTENYASGKTEEEGEAMGFRAMFLVATSENNEPYGTQTTRTSPVYRFLAQTL